MYAHNGSCTHVKGQLVLVVKSDNLRWMYPCMYLQKINFYSGDNYFCYLQLAIFPLYFFADSLIADFFVNIGEPRHLYELHTPLLGLVTSAKYYSRWLTIDHCGSVSFHAKQCIYKEDPGPSPSMAVTIYLEKIFARINLTRKIDVDIERHVTLSVFKFLYIGFFLSAKFFVGRNDLSTITNTLITNIERVNNCYIHHGC